MDEDTELSQIDMALHYLARRSRSFASICELVGCKLNLSQISLPVMHAYTDRLSLQKQK